ncbi:BTB/POZ domain-containing protein 17-like isoform X2 [Gigantopelta aegis]|uniref:BTB/POZ domain-containing protein 17-like isoform X2 n=1 Tax=Gigantopelta aegis TaxID=1735272 RepID=UPI001B88A7BA|nr:BTB/POZ domain-containing protein 17-like isoform X2 [Gigantopelta aegis]
MGNVFLCLKKQFEMQSQSKVQPVNSKHLCTGKMQNPSSELLSDEKEFIAHFVSLYDDKRFTDLMLRVGGCRYAVHKFVLITSSEVFEAMLGQKSWKEAEEAEISLTEEEECIPVFDLFLRYLYSGSIQMTTDIVLPVLLLADKYGIKVLRESCIDYMLRHIVESPDTNRTLTWYQYAKMTSQDELQELCLKFILSNFDIILQAPDWLEMTKLELVEFLSSSELIVENEIHLWNRVEAWLCSEHNKESLQENLESILPLIRFTMILPKDLLHLESSSFFSEHHDMFAEKLNLGYKHHSLAIDSGAVTSKEELYRNYYSADYGLCYSFKLDKYNSVNKIESRISIDCDIPVQFMPTSHKKTSQQIIPLQFVFYPKGYFTTITLYGTYLGRQSDSTSLRLLKRLQPDRPPIKVQLTLVLFGMKNKVKYVASTYNQETVICKDNLELFVENVIDISKLTQDDCPYLIHGNLEGKVFIKVQDCGFHLLEEKASQKHD